MPSPPGRIEYAKGAELPALALWLFDDFGDLIDFSSGYTFAFKIGRPGTTALTKTSGILGAAGSGDAPRPGLPGGVPNVTVAWSAGELNLDPGGWTWELIATASSLNRFFRGTLTITDVLS